MIQEKASRQGAEARREKDILTQGPEGRETINGDGNGKNIFTKGNKGEEIVASARVCSFNCVNGLNDFTSRLTL